MQKTENYQLNQWDKTDRIQMEDFNADNAKIDAAIKEAKDAAAVAAALATSTSKLHFGTYTGNGAESRTISLGFTPKAVYTCHQGGYTMYVSGALMYFYGGLALPDAPVIINDVTLISIADGGICVTNTTNNSSNNPKYFLANNNGQLYHYIAVE